MNTNLQNQIRSINPTQGNIVTFTVMPDQDAMRRHIEENSEDYGCKGNETYTEFQIWLDETCDNLTKDNIRYYATVVPFDEELHCEYSYPDTRCFIFDKFLEKTYEERETGWLYEVRPGLPKTFGDKDEVKVLQHFNEYVAWEDVQLGVITHRV